MGFMCNQQALLFLILTHSQIFLLDSVVCDSQGYLGVLVSIKFVKMYES